MNIYTEYRQKLTTAEKAVKKIKIPIVAIGGIDNTNINKVAATGVKRIAVVRAILKAKSSYSATKRLLRALA